VIDQALGIIMGQRNGDTDAAFAVRRAGSTNSHREPARRGDNGGAGAVTGKPPAPAFRGGHLRARGEHTSVRREGRGFAEVLADQDDRLFS
jgi:hypothetical protein